MRAADEPNRRGRRVLLVVGMEDEEQVERLGDAGIDLVVLGRHREHHVEQVRRIPEVVAGVHVRLADRLLERPGGQRRQLGDEAVDRDLDGIRVEDVLAVRVEGAHSHDAGGEDRHRMRVGRERVEEVTHLLADERVMHDFRDEPIELLLRRQLAPDEEIGDLEEGGVLGELLDRVAAVAEDALLPVEERDRARAAPVFPYPGSSVMRPVSERSLAMSMASSPSLPRTIGSDSSSSPTRSVAASVRR